MNDRMPGAGTAARFAPLLRADDATRSWRRRVARLRGDWLLPVLAALSTASAQAPETVTGEFPQRREIDGHVLLLHAPQIRSWPDFERFTADVAFELTRPGAKSPRLGTAQVSGSTTLDLPKRLVVVRSPVVEQVKFADGGAGGDPQDEKIVRGATRQRTLDVPLDLFLAHLADEVLDRPPPAGFNTAPPPILVRSTPTLLLFVNGKPVPAPIPDAGLERIVNASWPLVRESSPPGKYYLLERDRWLVAGSLESTARWQAASALPAGFTKIPANDPEYATLRAAVPLKPSTRAVPQVLFTQQPTELIVTDGVPALESIPDTGGLQRVRNTESWLFKLDGDWYFLASGRWFRSRELDKGPWSFVQELPAAFGQIPETSPSAPVRASVPGTPEAKMAVLEASVPRTTEVRRGSPPPVAPTYAGEPRFEVIPGTQVARAANAGFDVLLYDNRYYLCYASAWYVAGSPTGPWAATDEVPDAIYRIPPSSPAYPVTDVKVAKSTSESETVTYSSTAAYATGMFIGFGIAYYGTGWYYPPYYYPPFYYPYWPSYGHGSWYNPATGRYGSRSVWVGPYGGYSYNQAYNPRTGRYGYVETAWDGDEWASFGETYNPRTGVGTKTERYYDEDKNKLTMDRKVERGDEWIKTERKTDFDTGQTTVERETSRGGSSQTVRQDGQSATAIEGAGGGQAISVSGDAPGERATIARSESGDLYAGHDGNVYKKTDDGWQKYDSSGGWSPAEVADAATPRQQELAPTTRPSTGSGTTPGTRPASDYGSSRPSATTSQRNSSRQNLDRDYAARQRGGAQFQQRTMPRGGGMRRGR